MIVVDLNSIGFAATAANLGLSVNSKQTGGVFGTLRTMRVIREQHAGKIIGCWDGRSWRYDHLPTYKGNREANPKMIQIKQARMEQKPLVVRALRMIGVDQLFSINMEADDLAARIVASQKNINQDIKLITGDKDWLQLVSDRVTWVDPIRERRCTPVNFKEMTDFDTVWQFIQSKALGGDAGDNIPGVGGVGPVGARWIFDNAGSVDAILNGSITSESLKWPKKITDFVDSEEKVAAYKRNLLLVWLRHPDAPAAQKPRMDRGVIDIAGLTNLGEELNFQSILRDAEGWLAPFTREISKELVA